MKQYRAYIFDLYGTLVDIHTDERKGELWDAMRWPFFFNGARYQGKELYDAYFQEISRREEEGRKETGREVEIDILDVFRQLYYDKGVNISDRKVIKTALQFRKKSRTRLRMYAGAKELLRELRKKGKEIYLLSNAQAVFTNAELKELGIDCIFKKIYLSSDFGYKKPDELFFEAVLTENGLLPEECLMIGNDLYSDVLGATRVGMDSYFIRSGLSPKADYPVSPTYSQSGMNIATLRKRIFSKD